MNKTYHTWVNTGLVVLLGLLVLVGLGGNQSGLSLGGSTSDSWSVGGNLSVTGTSAFTGAGAFTGELRAPLVEGGAKLTLTATSTAQTLTAAQVCNSNFIEWDVQAVSSTLTLPTAANLVADCLTADGDFIEFLFDATSTSTTVVTIATGSNIELVGASTDDLIDQGNKAGVWIWRTSATTAIADIEEQTAAD